MVNVSGNRHIADGNSVIGQSHGVALDSGKVCKQNRPLGFKGFLVHLFGCHLGSRGFIMNIFNDIFLPQRVVNGDILTVGQDIAVHIINKDWIAKELKAKIDQFLK